MQLEPKEPSRAGLASLGYASKDLVLMNPGVMADSERGGIDETDARATAQTRVQIGEQADKSGRHELDEPLVGDQTGELALPVTTDVLGVEGLEVAVARLMEGDEYRYDFALREASFAVTLAGFDGVCLEGGQALLTEIIHLAEQMQ